MIICNIIAKVNYSNEERKYLELQEIEEIKKMFGCLISEATTHMKTSNTTSDDLKTFFSGCGMKVLANSIDLQDSIPATMRQVTDLQGWSFFDYKLLQVIINTLCKDEELSKALKDYIVNFEHFCEQRMCEIPVEIFDKKLPHVHSKAKLVMKIDIEFFGEKITIKNNLLNGAKLTEEELKLSLKAIRVIQYRMSEVLNIKYLTFLAVKEGIELTFRHFEEANPILLLNRVKKINLALLGVNMISCDTESYDLRSYVSPPPTSPKICE